jgi:hypothetical protein
MKRFLFFLSAAAILATSAGCCCGERLFNLCCAGSCPYGAQYGYDGDGCCSSCGSTGGGCSDCYASRGHQRGRGPGGAAMYDDAMMAENEAAMAGPQAIVSNHPADGHPLVRRRRNSGGEYEFAAGPPTGGVAYPYYTTRGPRDFLARTPRDIGP